MIPNPRQQERDTPLWIAAARDGRLDIAIVEFIRSRDWVTICELRDHLADYVEVRGDCRLDIAPNVTIWSGLNQEFADTIADLERGHKLYFWPASVMTYLVDGAVLNLPLAKRIPPGGYKTLRWLPVCLRLVPPKRTRRN